MEKLTSAIAILALSAGLLFVTNRSYAPVSQHILATDVSWPNCNTIVPISSDLGIVGVTGGLDFSENPCVFAETRWFSHYSLYINTGYPGMKIARQVTNTPQQCAVNDEICVAYDYGFAAGHSAVDYADSKGVHSTLWWLDVETTNSWSKNPLVNRAALRGTYDAVRQYTFSSTVGYYSYPQQWDRITGNWINGQPNWVATGTFSHGAAITACHGREFNGGKTWLTQYTQGLDKDYLCSQDFMNNIDKL